jgi:hypothetical protein
MHLLLSPLDLPQTVLGLPISPEQEESEVSEKRHSYRE